MRIVIALALGGVGAGLLMSGLMVPGLGALAAMVLVGSLGGKGK